MMLHPLINPESTHYVKDGRQSIQDIEEELTVAGMIAACTFNIMKYELRLDAKGQKESDLKKIQTYKNYRDLLRMMLEKLDYHDLIVSEAYRICGIDISYGV